MDNLEKILKMKISEDENIIENFLPTGIINFSGDPKVGKTYFLLQMCCSIAENDSTFLGLKTSNFTKILYFSTETNIKEIQKRIHSLNLKYENLNHKIKIDFRNEVHIKDIENELLNLKKKRNENVLVVLDTSENIKFDRFFDNLKSNDAYDITSIFKNLRNTYNASFILVKHNVKNNQSSNPFFAISGSIGVTASAETNIILTKNNDNDYVLLMQSRYLKDLSLNLKKNENGFFELSTAKK